MYTGVFAAVATLFDERGEVDEQANVKLIANLAANGVDGILVLGSTGEFFNLTLEERKRHLSFAAEQTRDELVMFAGTGGMDIRESVALTQHAQQCGFDAAVVMCPYYFALPESHIRNFFSTVASNVDIDIMLYNFPARTGVTYSTDMILSLIDDHANIVGIKDASANMDNTRKYINEVKNTVGNFSVFSGFDGDFVPNIRAGGNGVIGGICNFEPELFVRMRDALANGDMDTVRRCEERAVRLMDIYRVTIPFIPAVKFAIDEKVVSSYPTMRFSRVEMTYEEMSRIKEIIAGA